MGLQPLEFSDCYLDSPWFRERIRAHEAELERTNKFIKELIKDGKNLISATKSLSAAQRKFAHSLRDFKFEFIGDAETDDERCIDASLREFSNFLKNLEEQREIMALSVTETLIKPLEKFRKEQLGAVKEEKKKFDKETEKNYSLIDKHLTLSARKKDSHLQEADLQVEQNRQHFYELSLEYVCKLQEIQERKKFEFVEPMLSFFQGMFTFNRKARAVYPCEASPPNAPPRQSKRQGQRTKRPVAVYNLCLELEEGDSPSPLKEDPPSSSQDSLSTPSPTTSAAHGPPGLDGNHLAADGGSCGDATATTPSQTRPSMVQWLNMQSPTTPSSNPAGTPPSPRMSPFPLSPAASIVDKLPECVINRKARAVYPCEAESNDSGEFRGGVWTNSDETTGRDCCRHHGFEVSEYRCRNLN